MSHTANTDRQLIAGFAAHQQVRGFSPRTVERRNWSLTLFTGTGHLAQQTPATVELFLSRFVAAQTRQSVLSDLRQFYAWAHRRGLLTANPTTDVDPIRVPRRAATPLSAEHLRLAINTAHGDLLRAIMLGAYAGLRMSEITTLDSANVYHDLGLIVVRNGKGGTSEPIPLAPELAAVLTGIVGQVVSYKDRIAVSAAIRRHFRAHGIPNRPHDLRHSFGTAAARKANGNMLTVATLMRHASISTSQRYVRWNADGAAIVAGLHDPPAEAA